jgi:hypothetical protein
MLKKVLLSQERPCRPFKKFSASLPFSKAEKNHCSSFRKAVVFVEVTESPEFHIARAMPYPRLILWQSSLKIQAAGWGEQFPQGRSIVAMQKR